MRMSGTDPDGKSSHLKERDLWRLRQKLANPVTGERRLLR